MKINKIRKVLAKFPKIRRVVRITYSRNPLLKIVKRYLKVLKGEDIYCNKDINIPTVRIGETFGGYVIADELLNNESIVYSFGVGKDISFEEGLIERYGLKVKLFDPTPIAYEWVKLKLVNDGIDIHQIGIMSKDGKQILYKTENDENPNYLKYKTRENQKMHEFEFCRLTTLMNKFNDKQIDLLKMDIEGAEFEVLEDILSSNLDIKQIVLEFHHRYMKDPVKSLKEMLNELKRHNYYLFYVSMDGHDYSFIKK